MYFYQTFSTLDRLAQFLSSFSLVGYGRLDCLSGQFFVTAADQGSTGFARELVIADDGALDSGVVVSDDDPVAGTVTVTYEDGVSTIKDVETAINAGSDILTAQRNLLLPPSTLLSGTLAATALKSTLAVHTVSPHTVTDGMDNAFDAQKFLVLFQLS